MELIFAMEGNLGPTIMAKLEKEEDGASHCWCTYVGAHMLVITFLRLSVLVDSLQSNVVGRTCGSRK
jgi:hypothetical protein